VHAQAHMVVVFVLVLVVFVVVIVVVLVVLVAISQYIWSVVLLLLHTVQYFAQYDVEYIALSK
jgi:hypothetical protein